MLMYKWVHQAIAECTEEDHWDFHFLSEITWNDQSKMNEEVYKDHQDIDVLTKSLDSLWASKQSSFNTNALKMHMLVTRWDVCYKLAVSWVCIID